MPLGDWVLVQAVQQLAQWQRQLPQLVVSVNISALQFRQADFLQRVKTVVDNAGVAPQFIELEITETMLMDDMAAAIKTLTSLRELGFRIAIDDFGTGFSSLNYLRHLPIHVLKIDQSFVRDMLQESESLAIVESIIALAKALGKETIAEGVETAAEFDVLRDGGCHLMQGYHIARPMPAAAFDAWYQQHLVNIG